jgi:hypothetical protein
MIRIDWNRRTASFLVAVIYLMFALLAGGVLAALQMMMFLVLPLACIWFGDEMGGAKGLTFRGAYITKSSPGF